MNITLANFQIRTIAKLMEAMKEKNRDVVLKSCTGSGKTIILTHFMDEYCKGNVNNVFVWLTPGKASLEEQSKEKMDRYIHGGQTKLLSDVMTSGFEENDACFINWEKLTKKGNNALKDSERTNFIEHIEKALDKGLSFKIIVDESHQNDTLKADDIIQYFKTDKIIRCSATPKGYSNAIIIDVPEEDVIAEGLIKKVLIINQEFGQKIEVDDQLTFLLDKALDKQRELHSEFLSLGTDINPLIVVQIPNKNDVLLDNVERYFESRHITYENELLAVWLSDKKQNIEDISKSDAKSVAVIIKQAVATGWDCPRAQILVKLRDNMSETFEIQTIGRIRRMPEAKHYGNDLLDSCYLYTFDEKFTEGVRTNLGNGALNEVTLRLKPEYKDIKLKSQQRPSVTAPRDAVQSLKAIYGYFEKTYNVGSRLTENKTRLETQGYIFSDKIERHTISGEIHTLNERFGDLNTINVAESLSTHKHGREFHRETADIGLKIGLEYNQMNTIIRRLFDKTVHYNNKILALETRDVYAFVLNNASRLKHDIQNAMAAILSQMLIPTTNVVLKDFTFPAECFFTYDSFAKSQEIREKNVYRDYLSSSQPRSTPEILFEKYCEKADNILWVYKNGDKGDQYLSIIYEDSFGKQKAFFPDYVIGATDGVWIIETKGGFDRSGNSKDIDKFSARKFEVLKNYLQKYGLKGGIVREDENCKELCICTDNYSDDIKSKDWKLLKELL